jgi:hypothetical protein
MSYLSGIGRNRLPRPLAGGSFTASRLCNPASSRIGHRDSSWRVTPAY